MFDESGDGMKCTEKKQKQETKKKPLLSALEIFLHRRSHLYFV